MNAPLTATATAAALLALVPAATADAAVQRCKPTKSGVKRVIKIPDGKADVEVTEQTCVIRFPQAGGSSRYKAWVHTTWQRTGNGPRLSKRFEDYIVQARLEFNRKGPDTVIERRNCDITARINARPAGSHTCQTPVSVAFLDGRRAFTGDGRVIFDVDGDGKGNFRWRLTGSPRV